MRGWLIATAVLAAALSQCGPNAGQEKEKVDLLVVGGTVVTMNPEREVIENGAVAVRGERIVAVGRSDELAARYRAARRLSAKNRLVLPGLINGHTHAAMTLYRGLADDMVLEKWLEDYIFPLEARMTSKEFVYWGTKLAALEMIRTGTTTFVDMYYFEEEVARAASDAGMRAIAGETIIDFPAPDFDTPEEALAYTEKFIERWRDHPLIVPAVAPHSAYTNGEKTLKAAAALAERSEAPLLIHLAESQGEKETVRKRTGTTTARYLNQMGVLSAPVVVGAHCVYVDERDREILAQKNVGCVHNPSSNMKLASGVAPVPAMREAGVAVGLGTDGPAGSNNDLILWEEMDLAAKLQKVVREDPTVLPARAALAMATIEGARALGLADVIGSLEPGKKADLIMVRADPVHAFPSYDVYSQIVYSLKGSDAETVIVNGKVLMENGEVLTIDETELRKQVDKFAAEIRSYLATTR